MHGFALGVPQPHHRGFQKRGPRPNRTPWWRGARLGYTATPPLGAGIPQFFAWGNWKQVGFLWFHQTCGLSVNTTFVEGCQGYFETPWDHPWLGPSCKTPSQFKPVTFFPLAPFSDTYVIPSGSLWWFNICSCWKWPSRNRGRFPMQNGGSVHSYVKIYQGVHPIHIPLNHYKLPLIHYKSYVINHYKSPIESSTSPRLSATESAGWNHPAHWRRHHGGHTGKIMAWTAGKSWKWWGKPLWMIWHDGENHPCDLFLLTILEMLFHVFFFWW